jgi:hypothetical protein
MTIARVRRVGREFGAVPAIDPDLLAVVSRLRSARFGGRAARDRLTRRTHRDGGRLRLHRSVSRGSGDARPGACRCRHSRRPT